MSNSTSLRIDEIIPDVGNTQVQVNAESITLNTIDITPCPTDIVALKTITLSNLTEPNTFLSFPTDNPINGFNLEGTLRLVNDTAVLTNFHSLNGFLNGNGNYTLNSSFSGTIDWGLRFMMQSSDLKYYFLGPILSDYASNIQFSFRVTTF